MMRPERDPKTGRVKVCDPASIVHCLQPATTSTSPGCRGPGRCTCYCAGCNGRVWRDPCPVCKGMGATGIERDGTGGQVCDTCLGDGTVPPGATGSTLPIAEATGATAASGPATPQPVANAYGTKIGSVRVTPIVPAEFPDAPRSVDVRCKDKTIALVAFPCTLTPDHALQLAQALLFAVEATKVPLDFAAQAENVKAKR